MITTYEYPTYSIVLNYTDYDGNTFDVQKMIVVVDDEVWDFRFTCPKDDTSKAKIENINELLRNVIINPIN